MTEYTPDNWVVLKIVNENVTLYKVLAGWSGSYLNGSSWKLNSGITRVEEDDHSYIFHGHSGSKYICHKNSYRVRLNTAGILSQLLDRFPDQITMMDEDTNWANVVGENNE